ncbi:hypothetical protein L7F22_062121 [Adiantum nelumboides]|nr:hypothetical protein [Adiantum nelumboides]
MASSTTTTLQISPPTITKGKLDGTNYTLWKFKISANLNSYELLATIMGPNGEDPKPVITRDQSTPLLRFNLMMLFFALGREAMPTQCAPSSQVSEIGSHERCSGKKQAPLSAATKRMVPESSDAAAAAAQTSHKKKKNKIQVSSIKRPLFFYVNLAKRYLQQHEEVEMSGIGMAVTTLVTVAEILKNQQLAVEKSILTSIVDQWDDAKERMVQKAKIIITLAKSSMFDELMASTTFDDDESEFCEEVD